MNKSRKAFTLVELLISILVMFIIIGTVVMTGKAGMELFQKAQQNALVTNGLRMTLTSFNREIVPKLDNTTLVEILANNSDMPQTLPSSFDHYIYMQDGAIFHWDANKKEQLAGSEYISSLAFSVPKISDDNYINYIMHVDIEAVHPENANTKTSVAIDKALFSYKLTSKRGNSESGGKYTGSVLHFITADSSISVIASNLHILNAGGKVIDKEVIVGQRTISASYDITVTPSPAYEFKDTSTITWYISKNQDAILNLSDKDEVHEMTDENEGKYYWQVLNHDGTEISSRDITVGKQLYVKTKNGTEKWGKYGYLRFTVTPVIQNKNGTDEQSGDPAKSEYVLLDKRNTLWNIWTGVQNFDSGNGDFVKNAEANKLSVTIDKDSGLKVTLRGTTSDISSPSVILAKMKPEYLNDQKKLSVESDGKSYTTLTNCSIIVDAEVSTSDGYGILLNGTGIYTGKDTGKIYDTGLMFQVAAKTDIFPMRLYANGSQHKDANRRSWGIGDHGEESLAGIDGAAKTLAYTSDRNTHKFTGHGKTSKNSSFYGPFYGPGYMKNSLFQYQNNYYSDSNNSNPTWLVGNNIVPQKPYTERRRMMFTVLEYYVNHIITEPHFIIRVKYLKLEDDGTYSSGVNEDDDPLMIGPDWFLSEPIWYGGFVGQKPQKNGGAYTFTVKNYSSYPDIKTFTVQKDDIKLTTAKKPDDGEFYITSVTKDGTDGAKNRVNSVFEAADIDIREQILKTDFNKNYQRTLSSALYLNPKHDRYLGIRTWSNQNQDFETIIYNVELAPGFSKEELQAIMPKDAQMYEISYTGETAPEGIDQTYLSDSLFGGFKSDGKGNKSGITDGVMGIQHVKGKCTCPMCKKYLKK